MNKKLLLAGALIVAISIYANDCRYAKDCDFAVDAASLQSLRLNVGAGKLSIQNDPAINEVRVVATACASSRNRLDDLELTHRVRDFDLLVRAEHYQSSSIFSWFNLGNIYTYINIEVTMPRGLTLDVEDGSGVAGTYTNHDV